MRLSVLDLNLSKRVRTQGFHALDVIVFRGSAPISLFNVFFSKGLSRLLCQPGLGLGEEAEAGVWGNEVYLHLPPCQAHSTLGLDGCLKRDDSLLLSQGTCLWWSYPAILPLQELDRIWKTQIWDAKIWDGTTSEDLPNSATSTHRFQGLQVFDVIKEMSPQISFPETAI